MCGGLAPAADPIVRAASTDANAEAASVYDKAYKLLRQMCTDALQRSDPFAWIGMATVALRTSKFADAEEAVTVSRVFFVDRSTRVGAFLYRRRQRCSILQTRARGDC